jgi:hypothetical protein
MMKQDQEPRTLSQLLDRIEETANRDEQTSLDAILEAVGRRSFGPVLLLAGLVMLAPIIGDIPGVPSIMGVLVVLTAGQMLFHRQRIWLPRWLLKRSVTQSKLCKTLGWLRSPARFVDRLLRSRLTMFTHHAGRYVIAVVCILISAATPVMEAIPLSANIAGAAITAFGLALIAHDGLLALIAFAFTAVTGGLLVYNLL